nr:class I SAM-dependent methyltransferase [Collimonas pratensis]
MENIVLLKNLRPADEYDRFASQALEPWDVLFVTRIRQIARDMQPGVLVDIGTATVVVPVRLAADPVFKDWRFIGLDLDADMLEGGRPRIKALGLNDVIELKVGDALDLPFADNSLAMAVGRATLHHLPDKVKSLTEMYRVLQPGGIGLVHDMRRDVAPALLEKFTQMRAAVGYPPTHVEEKVTLEEARQLVRDAGLEHCTAVTSPGFGLGALGFEILIKKPLLA